MSIAMTSDRQAAIAAANRIFSSLYWRSPEDDDAEHFRDNPSARFLVRPWRLADDEFDQHYANTYDMECITIVFRLGCRITLFYPYIAERTPLAWRCALRDARWYVRDCPGLGLGANLNIERQAA